MKISKVLKVLLYLSGFLFAMSAWGGAITFSPTCYDLLISRKEIKIQHSNSKDVENPIVSKEAISAASPFEQPTAVLTIDGQPYAYGNKPSMERIKQDITLFKKILLSATLINDQSPAYAIDGTNVNFQLAPSLSGSTPINRAHSDIDGELLVVAEHRNFDPREFHDPNSATIRALAQYVKDYFRAVSSRGFIFSDFKAGEYDFIPTDAQDTKSRAIKWKAQEILDGRKLIPIGSENGPKKWISLEEALASEGRIKFDWILAIEGDPYVKRLTGLKKRYVELSTLFILGGRRGLGTPVLKVSSRNVVPPIGASGAHLAEQNRTQLLPVRTTTVYFNEDHMELAREASVSTPAVDIRFLNNVVLNSIHTYFRHDNLLKVLKLLSTRFYYWNDFQYFKSEHPEFSAQLNSTSDLKSPVDEIIHQPVVEALSVLKSSAQALKRLRELNEVDPKNERALFRSLQRIMRRFDLPGPQQPVSLDELVDICSRLLNKRVQSLVSKNPMVESYIAYVLQLEYSKTFEFEERNSAFVSFRLPQTFIDAYDKMYADLVSKFPNVRFSKPEDLHMTIAFLSRMTPAQTSQVSDLISGLQRKLSQFPFDLHDGVIKIIGSKNSQLAMVFDEKQLPAQVLEAITDFKAKILRLGVRPDSKHSIDDFLPHISFAYTRGMHFDPEGHYQVSQLLFNGDLYRMNHAAISGELNLQYVKSQRDGVDLGGSRYYSEPIP